MKSEDLQALAGRLDSYANLLICGEMVEDLRAAARVVREAHKHRWRPITEMHEDHSLCVVMNVRDPNPPHVAAVIDDNFEQNVEAYGWTHFQQILLTFDEAADLLEAIEGSLG